MDFIVKVFCWVADQFFGSLVAKAADFAVPRFGVQHGVQDAIENLKSSSEKSRLIINQVEKLRIQDEDVKKRLKKLLMKLRDAAYDADDLLDEFEYEVLKKQVEQQENESTYFSLPSSSIAVPATKKPRMSVSTIVDSRDRVQKINERIESITGDISQLILLFPLSDLENQQQLISSTSRTRSSFPVETEVFGRDKDFKKLKDLLLNASDGAGSSNSSIPVLAIVGIGGIGKTTLAQQVYNDEAVQEHFQLKIWVCVFENFSVERLTKEILEYATGNKCELTNLNALHVLLTKKITSKKLLLVLDDMWNEDSRKWETFYAPLKMGVQGSKILVTTRSTKIAGVVGALDPIHLACLEDESFWAFFKKCVFGSQNNGDHPPELEAIAKTIAKRLKGLPLAAKTVGGLLKNNMEKSYWEIIMNSEIWQLEQNENDVLPVLQLSYQCLPAHLKRCFAICSLFCKDYGFNKQELVGIWIAEGFIIPQGKERMEDAGSNYFEDLVSRSFFQKSRTNVNYVMHDLIHDLSQLVSDGECHRLENGNTQAISSLQVRHLSVWPPESKTADDTLERKLLAVCPNNKWRSLIWYGDFSDTNTPTKNFPWRSLTYIRVLILRCTGIVELPEDVGELRHLRYLDVSYNYEIRRLPDSLCRLHNLQVLRLYGCPIWSFPQGMSKLTNLRHIYFEKDKLISKIYRIGRLTSLQQLDTFKVQDHPGHKLEELGGLTQIHGKLQISNLENVGSIEEANAGRLHNKVFIDELSLEWMPNQDISSENNQLLILEELLKDLKWHPTLKKLKICGYSWAAWDESHIWAKDIKLFPSDLYELRVSNCPKLERLPPLPPSLVKLELRRSGLMKLPNIWEEIDGSGNCKVATLKRLYINCPNLTSLEDGLLSQNLPYLETIILVDCEELMGLSMEKLKVFASLKELTIVNCPKLRTMTGDMNYFRMLLQSVNKLNLSNCGNLGKLLPRCLPNLTSLTHLEIAECPHLRSFPKKPLLRLKQLEIVRIDSCDQLRSIEGLGVLISLKNLSICKCPNLLINGRDKHGGEEEEGGLLLLRELCIDNTALLKVPPLRKALPSIHRLQIQSSVEEVMFEGEEQELLWRLTVLRILKFSWCTKLQSLPKELYTLPSLELLFISDCPEIESLPETGLPTSLTDLRCEHVNTMLQRQIEEKVEELRSSCRYRYVNEHVIISKINNIGKLINLQTLPTFKVLKSDGHNLTELSSLTQLHRRLRILNLENVVDKMEASAAKLHDKVHLHELVLAWTSNQNSSLDDTVLHASEQILEELQPHSKLRSLTIRGYSGAKTPSWLHTETLASLETLRLENCGRWEDASFIRQMLHLRSLYLKGIPAMKQTTQELFGPPMENKFFQGLKELVLEGMDLLVELSSLGNLPCLKILHITGMPALKILGLEFYGFIDQGNHFPCLEELKFNNMSEWEEWYWTEDGELFPCLHVLKIEDCPKLRRLPPLPPSLTTLELWQGGLSELPGRWNKINGSSSNMTASLSKLNVFECPNLRMLEQGLLFHDLPNIKSIEIHECQELMWLPVKRFKEFTSLKNLSIKNCPMLMSSTEYKSDELLLPPSIQKLTLLDCGNLSETLPHCLRNLPSISDLEFGHTPSQG